MRTLWLLSSAALSALAAARATAEGPAAPPAPGLETAPAATPGTAPATPGTAPGAPGTAPGAFEAAPESGRILVLVAKKGVFSAFAHDHRFLVAAWHATAQVSESDPARAKVEVVLEAASLHDREEGLSESDRAKVDEKAAGPDVLDAARHPEITWRSEKVTLDPAEPGGRVRGTAHGQLTMHGVTRPVVVAFDARREGGGWRVEGKGRLKQSDFGIEPFSGFLGTVGVEDEVGIEVALTLRPAGR